MEYERIEKPFPTQGGGFSPKRLRAMLLGVDKRRKGQDEDADEDYDAVPKASVRSDADARGGSTMCEEYKDVDVVSTISESSSSVETGSGHRSRDTHSIGSRTRAPEEDSCDSESVASNFEFHKERGASARSVAAPVVPPFSKPAPSKWDNAQKWIASPTANRPCRATSGALPRKVEKPISGAGRLPATKVVLEATEEIDTKRIDPSQEKREIGWQKAVSWAPPDPCPEVEPCSKSALVEEETITDSAECAVNSSTLQSATACIPPPSTVRSVSMRDMGTEMTPIASQEPSRTGTPLGKTNIAAWASKKEEKDASLLLKTLPMDQSTQNLTEIRAAAWEEAEKAKYLARFKREEIKIQAWEDHQKAKIEAEMRKIEVEVERMRARAQDKLMTHLASARHTADEKRADAESKRNRAAARTAEQAEYIRRTGRVPPSFGCWNWCS
ncbi:hypothetical protein QOZ80_2BG0152730 [Eleusine coracana subsp. coracana]|nr:hypothetical protein QOZ80_2BG0152730 [Eleusine coracana subsp. coracana]